MPTKYSTKHPFAAIEHRVIDSAAYADLSHSACRLLTLLARQLTRESNNGHLQATFTWCRKRGIGSEHTLRDAIADLITHGFIYRTRSHGANKAWARYAVTWLQIKDRKGLFLDRFKANAWRDWEPSNKKSTQQKVQEQSGRMCSSATENPSVSAGNPLAKSADYELIPCSSVVSTHSARREKIRSELLQSERQPIQRKQLHVKISSSSRKSTKSAWPLA